MVQVEVEADVVDSALQENRKGTLGHLLRPTLWDIFFKDVEGSVAVVFRGAD